MSNRLKNETSPYLLQHADNPVDWYPWCSEAFQKARNEDKPIFLSIGYSTCHWCHVMAHESFEDEEIARILNKNFVSVKVDREERPDIDSIYMSVCLAFTGSGGWPTSIFMTPDQKPFFAGTYFPKSSRGRMLGLGELLEAVAEKWKNDRESLLKQSEAIVSQLNQKESSEHPQNDDLPEIAVSYFKKLYDKQNGGFGRAPKFPTPHNLVFLLNYYERYHDEACLEMAEHTLLQMYRGGMFDHVGYGFCRYSTDEYFLVPHFEKMLYDNALLISAYCKAYSITQNRLYLDIAEKTASYVIRELTSESASFFSAQDADSEGEEGKYYLFTPDEIISVLGKERGHEFNKYFDITKQGNFEGKNIPNLLKSDVTDNSFDDILPQLRVYRKKRTELRLDDKILTFWNGLMISAFCSLYRVSKNAVYLNVAQKAESLIRANLFDNEKLFVSFRAGRRGVEGFLDDYAGYISALISLYGATLKYEYIDLAKRLCAKVMSDFSDKTSGGFFLYGINSECLISRPKETYDGALPSGNSLMAQNLVRLAQITGDELYISESKRQLDFLTKENSRYPYGSSVFLTALLEYSSPSEKIVAVLADEADKEKIPLSVRLDATVCIKAPNESYPLLDGKTTFCICRGNTCEAPTNDWNKLK